MLLESFGKLVQQYFDRKKLSGNVLPHHRAFLIDKEIAPAGKAA
jgi:hypothetical protein